ncbi:CinA family nicotinamide mononucleotide deamidase-related protein [Crocinitomix algicola]|uniref:CinA family nicotinamide mononucleotide deamidase-related protein n=1 Tax=Crocinitomix algicola TaxID=1740263 RepID=UPI00082DAFF6|nr:CinA family nicotinamide mononucleotide deamidase-related protein [Crocinitomix algicola]
MDAIIITIGDEILVGQTVDTNSAHIARKINELGIQIKEIISISDTADHITSAVDSKIGNCDFLFLTGGLGPTNDDITKKVLTQYFDDDLVLYPEVLERIENFFQQFNKPFLEVNRLQAMLPKNAKIIPNDLGTASGMWFKKGRTNVLSMPGVPYEMKGLLDKFLEQVKEKYPIGNFYHRTLQIIGIGESYWAETIKDWETKNLKEGISVSYLPTVGTLKLRLTGRLDQKSFIDQNMDELYQAHPNYVLGEEFSTIESVLGEILVAQNQTIGTVESCTGGSIAKRIVSMSGSSEFYSGSIISYTNELKSQLVGVPEQIIKTNGAVSQPVVEEMAKHGRRHLKVDYCISVSGIAGPTGGSDEKPVGTVWVGLAGPDFVQSKKFNFGHNRERNIEATTISALNFLRLRLIDKKKEALT